MRKDDIIAAGPEYYSEAVAVDGNLLAVDFPMTLRNSVGDVFEAIKANLVAENRMALPSR